MKLNAGLGQRERDERGIEGRSRPAVSRDESSNPTARRERLAHERDGRGVDLESD